MLMKNIRKILFILFAILFHNTLVPVKPTSLETSLMLLKAKLLNLAITLSSPSSKVIPWDPFTQEKTAKRINVPKTHNREKDYIKNLEQVIQADLKINKEKKLNAADLLSAFLAGRNYKEQTEFLLNTYSDNVLQKIFGNTFEKTNDSRFITIRKAQLVENDKYELMPEILEPKALDDNTVRVKTAKKWIRNAAVRIFNDPLRSFLELVVNGVDATVEKYWGPEHSVGKFGMGFFSILALLWWRQEGWDTKNYGTTITVTTAARRKPNKPITVYRLSFDKVPDKDHPDDPNYDDIEITITMLSKENPEYKAFWEKILTLDQNLNQTELLKKLDPKNLPTGTIVSITPKSGNTFSDTTLDTIQNYIHYLDMYPYVNIILERSNRLNEAIGKSLHEQDKNTQKIPDMPSIQAILNEKTMTVVDAGTGMTLETLLFKLLIPSVSTKREEKGTKDALIIMREKALATPAPSPELITFDGKPDKTKSHFLISVNGVIVVNRVLQQPILDKNGNVQDLVIHMPQATQLTIARNELSIGESEDNFEKKYLEKIVNETIDTIMTGKDKEKGPLLLALYNGLKDWENQSAAHHIKGHFSGHLKQTLKSAMNGDEGKNFIPIPEVFAKRQTESGANIFDENDGSIRVMLDSELVDYNFSKFEEYIQNRYRTISEKITNNKQKEIITDGLDGKLIAGFKVCFVPNELLPQGKTADGKKYAILSSLGTRTTLFAPQDFLWSNDRQTIIDTITSRCTFQKTRGLEKGNEDKTDLIMVTNATENLSFEYEFPEKKDSRDKQTSSFINANEKTAKKIQDIIINYCLDYMNDGFFWNISSKRYRGANLFFYANMPVNTYLLALEYPVFLFNENNNVFLKITGQKNYSDVTSWDDLEKATPDTSTYKKFTDKKGTTTNVQDAIKTVINDIITSDEIFKKLIHTHLNQNSPWAQELTKHWYLTSCTSYTAEELIALLFYMLFKNFNFLDNSNSFRNNIFFCLNKNNLIKKKLTDMTKDELDTLFSCLFFYENYVREIVNDLDGITRENTIILGTTTGKLNTFISLYKRGINPVLIYLENIQQEDALAIQDYMKNDFRWAASINFQLIKTIKNLNINRCLNDVVTLFLPVLDREASDVFKKGWISMLESCMGLYNKYFDIKPSACPTIYGDSATVNAMHQENDIQNNTVTIITTIFNDLEKKKTLFEKLIQFQIKDFIAKTDTNAQLNDLSKKILCVPALLANTPLSLLIKICKDLNSDIAYRILERSRNPEEFAFICYVFLQNKIQDLLKKINTEKYDIIDYAIKNYFQEKIDSEHIEEIYRKNRITQTYENRLKNLEYDLAVEICEEIFKTALEEASSTISITQSSLQDELADSEDEILAKYKNDPKNHSPFLASENLAANMIQNGLLADLNAHDLQAAKDKLRDAKGTKSIIGKIQQCVEAGSEKSAIEGTIIETLQNSIDAVKGVYKKNLWNSRKKYKVNDLRKILFTIQKKETNTPDKNHLILTIHDQAGFPSLSALLVDFLLPDFSNKTPEQGNIGDMGNGSFKIYQDAYQVSLLTRLTEDSNKFYLLVIKPKRTKAGLVEDLECIIEDVSETMRNKAFWGTSIKITFKETEAEKADINVLAIRDFLNNCVGSVHAYVDENKLIPFSCILIEKNSNPKNNKEKLLNQTIEPKDSIFEYKASDFKKNDWLTGTEIKTFKDEYKKRFHKPLDKNTPLFRIIRRKSKLLQSYVTTWGIPFRPFGALAREMALLPANFINRMNHEFIIDLDISAYSPVQSRAQLTMSDALLKVFRHALFESYYIIGLHDGYEETQKEKARKEYSFLARNFTHYYSEISELSQLKLGSAGITDLSKALEQCIKGTTTSRFLSETLFFDYYCPKDNGGRSFFSYLNNEVDKVFKDISEKLKEHSKKSSDQFKQWEKDNATNIDIAKNNHTLEIIENLEKSIERETNPLIQNFERARDEIFSTWEHSNVSTIDQQKNKIENSTYGLFRTIVYNWAQRKVENIGLKTGNWRQDYLKTLSEIEKEKKQDDQTNDLIKESSLQTYAVWNIMGKGIKSLFEEFCKIALPKDKQLKNFRLYYNPDSNTAGFYRFGDVSINLNLKYFNITMLANLFLSIIRFKAPYDKTREKEIPPITSDELKFSSSYNEYFAENKLGNATTINHELEHARRNDTTKKKSDDHGAHDNGTDPITGEPVDFETCANRNIEKAMNEWLFDVWTNEIYKNWMHDTKNMDQEELNIFINDMFRFASTIGFGNLKKLESIDKEKLVKKLGFKMGEP